MADRPRKTVISALLMVVLYLISAAIPVVAQKEHTVVLDRVLAVMSRYYWDTGYKGLDWTKLTAEARQKIEQAPDIEKSMDVIADLLAKLSDHHTRLEYPGTKNIDGTEVYGGIGCSLNIRKEGYCLIAEVFEGSPAQEAGLKAGDRIWAVDKVKVEAFIKDNKDPVSAIRGKEGTKVVLTVEKSDGTVIDVTVDRRQIVYVKKPVVERYGDSKEFGYISWSSYYDNIAAQISEKLDELSDTKGLIIDMRNNPGGYIKELVKIAAYLDIKDLGKSVSRDDTTLYRTMWIPSKYKKPIAILVNEGTGSAAEILSTVAKESGRAVLVGQPTSNGTAVATTFDLGNGYTVNVTIAQFFTPKGSPYNAPTQPDIRMPDFTDEDYRLGRDPWIEKAVEVLKEITAGSQEYKLAS